MQNIIKTVKEGSPAALAGIVPGDRLLAVDGKKVRDVLDYMYYAYDEEAVFTLERAGETFDVPVRKGPGEDAGLEFETYLMDKPRSCANKCVFCFVDQLPKGLRDTLYFKDDDMRLSFLTGSYITLTNLSEREIQRMIDLRISPVNISVHTTDPALRCLLLGNKNAGRGVELLHRFAEAGIEMNCQIVCCPGLNDGAALLKTMKDLRKLHPQVRSVSVIPVGLTKHREGLYPLTPYDRESAGKTVDLVEAYGRSCLRRNGSRIFFCSDEFYLKAGRTIPGDAFYEDYPQLENGVGLVRLLMTEFDEAVERAVSEGQSALGTCFTIATGVSASGTLGTLLERAKARFPGVSGQVIAIQNDFFGHSVDVAGLITGQDLIAQLRGRELGSRVYITNRMLREGEDVFLDDVTLSEASEAVGVPIVPLENSGEALLAAMLA